MKHTFRPWKIYTDGAKTFIAAPSAGRIVATGLYDENSDTPLDEIEANARLIAAAPELLEAAKRAVGIIRESYGPHDVDLPRDGQAVDLLEKAILQAQGRNDE